VRGKRRIPSGTMLNACNFPAVLALVGFGTLMAHELHSGLRVLAFAQPREVFGANCTVQSPLLGQPALPFAVALLITAPVVLALGGELPRVIRACLARR
jgi:hypothetical protein